MGIRSGDLHVLRCDGQQMSAHSRERRAEASKLAEALAQGGKLLPLLDALKMREQELAQLRQRQSVLKERPERSPDSAAVRERLREVLRQWRQTLTNNPTQARLMMRKLVEGRLVVQPKEDDDGEFYEFQGQGTLTPVVSGVLPHKLASPSIPSWNQIERFLRDMAQLRQ